MLRWICAVSASAVLTGFAVLLLTARYPSAGPVVLRLTATHGVHLGDLGVVTAWVLGMTALLGLVTQGRPGPPRDARADPDGPRAAEADLSV